MTDLRAIAALERWIINLILMYNQLRRALLRCCAF